MTVNMDSFAELEALARKLGLEDDKGGLPDERNGQLRTSDEDKGQLTTDEHVYGDSYVLVLIDVHSHPVCLCPISCRDYANMT